MAKLFGFKLPDSGDGKASKSIVSPVPPSEEELARRVSAKAPAKKPAAKKTTAKKKED